MTCKRCGFEFGEATEDMREYELCIHCIMEWHRKGEGSLLEWSKTSRVSHFKM